MNRPNSSRNTGQQLDTGRMSEQAAESPAGETLKGATPEAGDRHAARPAADRQPRYSGVYTVIPPNESRRNEMRTVAQRDEEALQRWREQNRVQSVSIDPERLGGSVTLAEAREKQARETRSAKLQKKLKKEEMERKKRQEEAEELQAMKDEQRKKAEQQDRRRRQEAQRRSEQLGPDHLRTNESFLQGLESRAPHQPPSSGATHTSSRVEDTERKQAKSLRDVQQDHRRVNSAFLDRLEGGGGQRSVQVAERPRPSAERCSEQSAAGPEAPDPGASESDGSGGDDPELHSDSTLTSLVRSFPNVSIDFLEDILDQCGGDYEQAFSLLTSTLA